MEIAVFGATGRTGRPLIEQALERGHRVIAFARSADAISGSLCTHESLLVVEGDAYTGSGVAEAIVGGTKNSRGNGVNAVVSVLGQASSGPDDLLTVAGWHILEAMNNYGVDRFITLVGAGVREEGESVRLSFGGESRKSFSEVLLCRDRMAIFLRVSHINRIHARHYSDARC